MPFEDESVRNFLEAVASKQPTPGGGAVASIVAALAAALARMVVNYSIGKKSLAAHDSLHQEALAALREQGERALQLAEEDARAYDRLNALWKLDKANRKRVAEFASAVDEAIAAPHAVLHVCMETLRSLQRLAEARATNVMLASDLAIAAVLTEAGARSAAWNVRINLPLLEDEGVRATFERTIVQTLADADELCQQIEMACAPRT